MGKLKKEKQLWRARTSVGREKLVDSPNSLRMAAKEYFDWCDSNPMYSEDWKEGQMRQFKHKRAYTMAGLCIFLDVTENYFRTIESRADEKDTDAQAFVTVINQIKQVMYEQKFNGAAAGFFNANIIARDLGLTDKSETKTTLNLGNKPIEFE